MVDSGENLGVLPFVPWVLSPFWGPTGSILKTSGLLDPGGSLQLSPLGVPLRTLELLVWIILGAQPNLLNKLMTVWLFVCSQICGSQAQNSKRVFQTPPTSKTKMSTKHFEDNEYVYDIDYGSSQVMHW